MAEEKHPVQKDSPLQVTVLQRTGSHIFRPVEPPATTTSVTTSRVIIISQTPADKAATPSAGKAATTPDIKTIPLPKAKALSPPESNAVPKPDAKAATLPASKTELTPNDKAAPSEPTIPDVPLQKEKPAEPVAPSLPLSDREVVAHTASLWKYRPIPKDEPAPYPEYLRDCAVIKDFHVTAARVRGKKHKHEGTNCDDWFETFGVEKFVVAAVSDGAGSKKFSRIGARASCEGAKRFLETELPKTVHREIDFYGFLNYSVSDARFQDAAAKLARVAQNAVLKARESVVNAFAIRKNDRRYIDVVGRELALADFAATFLLTIALPLEHSRDILVVTVQVGDGMIAALNTRAPYEEAVTLLGQPDSGAFAGETEFLVSPAIDSIDALGSRTRLARKPFDFIMSMTDGVADDYDPNETQMMRLYFDLKVNHIIDAPELEEKLRNMDSKLRFDLGKKIPNPEAYPRIDGSANPEHFPIQYTSALCEACSLTLKDLWADKEGYLALMASSINPGREKNAASRLEAWLDNYVLRGSFDDRTLIILQRGDS